MAIGDITENIIDTLILDSSGSWPKLLTIDGNVHVCVYQGSSGEGIVETFSCDKTGNLAAVARWEFAAVAATPFISPIAGTIYAIITSTHIYTLSIADNGTITESILATYALSSVPGGQGGGNFPLIQKCGGTFYIAAWDNGTNAQATFDIPDNGSSITFKDQWGIEGQYWDCRPIAGNWFFASFKQQSQIKCEAWEVNPSTGNFDTRKAHNIYSSVSSTEPTMAKVGGTTTSYFVNLWRLQAGPGDDDLVMETTSADDAGSTPSQVEFHGSVQTGETNKYPHIVSLEKTEDLVGMVWRGTASDGWLTTYDIDNVGDIGSQLDQWEFETGSCNYPFLHRREDSNIVMIAYEGSSVKIITIQIEMAAVEDRIYVWLGDEDSPEDVELTDPDYNTVLGLRTEIGRDEQLAEATAGIALISCDNFYGDFSPELAGGQYVGKLQIGKLITVYEIYDGIQYPHFQGRIHKIEPHGELDNPLAFITALDGLDDLAEVEVNTVMRTDTEAGELFEDILDAAGWSATKRDVDTGIDTLQLGWFHKTKALKGVRTLEKVDNGFAFVSPVGYATFQNRHYRVTGDGLVSQHDFEDTAVELIYEYSKRLVYNEIIVRGRRYFVGGVSLFSGYDMGTLDDELVWSAHTGDAGAPYVAQNTTLTLQAEFNSPLESYDALVKGTHWNANTSADKTGTDVSANVSLSQTQFGQSIKLVFTNAGGAGAFLVVPDSPPTGAPAARTVLVYGILYSQEIMAITEENSDSQDDFGKRTMDVDVPFKSNPNDILAHTQYLLARHKDAVPRAVSIRHSARTAWPDDTLRIQCLVRQISDRITIKSTRLGFDRDFYINKVTQDYLFLEGGMVHETTWNVERAEGVAEGLYWLLGEVGFGELGEVTVLGF